MYDLVKFTPENGALRYLTILATDATEQQLYDYRFDANDHSNIHFCNADKSALFAKSLINDKGQRRGIEKIGFLSRDFSQSRPSGQLAEEFFRLLHEYAEANGLKVFFYTPFNKTTALFKTFATLRQARTVNGLARLIYQDELDILIDMQGHMHSNFNNALIQKPAPIIMHWLGYPGTTGFREVDYLFADETVVPLASRQYYREKIIYLPNCYQINNPKLLVSESMYKRSDFEYPEGDEYVLFAHFNDSYKVDKATWILWCKILTRIPNSRLVFLSRQAKENEMMINDAVERGVQREQLIVTKRLPRQQHIHRLALLNIGLDPYYCNGHTTSSDLIAAGRPFVTRPGETYQSRVALSILRSLDLEELAAKSEDEYVEIAVKLATDREYYRQICDKIVRNRTLTLYNPSLYLGEWLRAINNVWKNHIWGGGGGQLSP